MYINVGGHRMLLDNGDAFDLERAGGYEPLVTKLCEGEIAERDTVLDLGANIGYHTLKFARLVGRYGKVFAFEPEPVCFSILRRNVEINKYQNVIVVQKAVSDIAGEVSLYIDDVTNGGHSICRLHDGCRSVVVGSVRLDDFADCIGEVGFIKMDIEGSEPRALDGMSCLLGRSPKAKLVTELNPSLLALSGSGTEIYIEQLYSVGFQQIYYINDLGGRVELVDVGKLVELFSSGILECTNLFCVK